jgi:hypothetical protein
MRGRKVSTEASKEYAQRLGGSNRGESLADTQNRSENGGWSIEVVERQLKYIKLDYTSSDSEVIVLVDASERKEEIKELGDKGDAWPMAARHVT